MCFPGLNSPEAFKNKTLPRDTQYKHTKDPHNLFYQVEHSFTNFHFCFFYVVVKALPILNTLG